MALLRHCSIQRPGSLGSTLTFAKKYIRFQSSAPRFCPRGRRIQTLDHERATCKQFSTFRIGKSIWQVKIDTVLKPPTSTKLYTLLRILVIPANAMLPGPAAERSSLLNDLSIIHEPLFLFSFSFLVGGGVVFFWSFVRNKLD